MKKIFLIVLLSFFGLNYSFAVSCPVKTTAGYNFIDFVGRLDGLGGDKEVKVWFEYGTKKINLNKKTSELNLTEAGIFCLREKNLKPCTTYYYRAAAKNSAGTNNGGIKVIKTLCGKGKNEINLIKNNKNGSREQKIKWVIF